MILFNNNILNNIKRFIILESFINTLFMMTMYIQKAREHTSDKKILYKFINNLISWIKHHKTIINVKTKIPPMISDKLKGAVQNYIDSIQ